MGVKKGERAGQNTRPSQKHCKACAIHAHASPPHACAPLYNFRHVKFSNHPYQSSETTTRNNNAGETSSSTNYELQGTGRATRAPVAQTLQSVRQTCPCTMATCPYPFARFPSCGIFIPPHTIPVKQRVETTG